MSQATYDPDLAGAIIRYAALAADMEALKPTPASSVRNPDGSAQYETGAERTRRIVGRAVTHLLEVGLLVIPDDAREKMEQGIPLDM